jgi:hypothetical protein
MTSLLGLVRNSENLRGIPQFPPIAFLSSKPGSSRIARTSQRKECQQPKLHVISESRNASDAEIEALVVDIQHMPNRKVVLLQTINTLLWMSAPSVLFPM